MATKVYTVTAPDGTPFKIRGPEGASKEEIISQAKTLYAQKQQAQAPAPEAPNPDAELLANQEQRGTTLSSLLGDYAEKLPQITPATLLAKGAEKIAPDMLEGIGQKVQDAQTGFAGGVGNLVEGIRQGYNKLTGDAGELNQLNMDTEMRRRRLAELTKNNPMTANIGEVAGEAVPTIMSGGALGAATAPAKFGTAARLLGSVGAGGAQGYMSALTPEEEASGERASRAKIGAALGGVGSAIGPMAKLAKTRWDEYGRKVMPDKAAADFLKRTTGLTDDTADTYSKILGGTQKEIDRVRGISDANYDDALVHEWEKSGNIGFPLHGIDRLFKPMSKDIDEVTAGTREIMNSSNAVSDLFHAANTSGTKTVDVPVALQAIKDLNKFANDPEMAKTARVTAASLADDLRDQSKLISSYLPEFKAITDKHDLAQNFWEKNLVPLEKAGKGQPVGTWMDEMGATQKGFEDTFLSGESSEQLKDLFARVPGIRDDVRKFWGTTRLGQPELHRALAPNTTRDIMFTNPEERKYATMLSTALRGGVNGEEANSAAGLAKRLTGKFSPLVNLVLPERAKSGVFKYGDAGKKHLTKADKMAAALKATALMNALQPQNDVAPIGGQ